MATVITNLLSAIPWIGTDFVEFINTHILNKIINIILIYLILFSISTIGIIRLKALRGRKPKTEEEKLGFINIPYEFLSMFVGLVDGDGYIAIIQTGDYIKLELVISMHMRDSTMLKNIQSILGIGRIKEYPSIDTVKYTIPRIDLQEILFPLLAYHNLQFLTNTRISQYNLAIYILKNNILYYSDIPNSVPTLNSLPLTAIGYTELPFFQNWIIGFTISEGSFFVKQNNDFCFSLKQRTHYLLFEAFKIIFSTTRNIEERNGHSAFVVSSKKDIQNVVNFFFFLRSTSFDGL